MALSEASATGPRVLFVYFTYTQQSLKVAEAMAEVLRGAAATCAWPALS